MGFTAKSAHSEQLRFRKSYSLFTGVHHIETYLHVGMLCLRSKKIIL